MFFLSCAVGLQSMDRMKFAVIVWIVGGTLLAVGGEMHFVMIGFRVLLDLRLGRFR